mmetsp:Transcript_20408/g.31221  ORF Transcript_20408/g.31221 Transcript_20408/m.31221 type:complete len:207 (+) Transcript_20408:226-846(+)
MNHTAHQYDDIKHNTLLYGAEYHWMTLLSTKEVAMKSMAEVVVASRFYQQSRAYCRDVPVDTLLHYRSVILGSPVIAYWHKGSQITSCRMLDKVMRGAQLQNALQMVSILKGEDLIKDGARVGITVQMMRSCHRFAKSSHEYPRLKITSESHSIKLNEPHACLVSLLVDDKLTGQNVEPSTLLTAVHHKGNTMTNWQLANSENPPS